MDSSAARFSRRFQAGRRHLVLLASRRHVQGARGLPRLSDAGATSRANHPMLLESERGRVGSVRRQRHDVRRRKKTRPPLDRIRAIGRLCRQRSSRGCTTRESASRWTALPIPSPAPHRRRTRQIPVGIAKNIVKVRTNSGLSWTNKSSERVPRPAADGHHPRFRLKHVALDRRFAPGPSFDVRGDARTVEIARRFPLVPSDRTSDTARCRNS